MYCFLCRSLTKHLGKILHKEALEEALSIQSPDVVLEKVCPTSSRDPSDFTQCPWSRSILFPCRLAPWGQPSPAQPMGPTGVSAAARARLKNTAWTESLSPGAPWKPLQSVQWESGHSWIQENEREQKADSDTSLNPEKRTLYPKWRCSYLSQNIKNLPHMDKQRTVKQWFSVATMEDLMDATCFQRISQV